MCDHRRVHVYTTIFLAETTGSDTQEAGHFLDDREIEHRLIEIKRTSLECITMLEARNWFTDDLPSDE